MLQLQQIKSASDKYFEPILKLYFDSFPPNERRSIEDIKDLIFASKELKINAIVEANECMNSRCLVVETEHTPSLREDSEKCKSSKLCGLMIYWNFDDFYYLEHFAVLQEMRNHKIGERALNLLKEIAHGKTLFGEVEPADNELAIRRIGFYERNGFSILDKNYFQPPYSKDKEGLPLWIMGITNEKEKIGEYVERMKKSVYFCN